jgi:hypothetical protein
LREEKQFIAPAGPAGRGFFYGFALPGYNPLYLFSNDSIIFWHTVHYLGMKTE